MRRLGTYCNVHLVSDSTGETLAGVMRATCAQFDGILPIEHSYFLVRSARQLDRVVREIEGAPGVAQRVINAGDPYQWQVEQSAAAVRALLPADWGTRVCYQSRVGPLQWIGPSTEEEIEAAGEERMRRPARCSPVFNRLSTT